VAIKYVGEEKTRLDMEEGGLTLIWGDPCHVIGPAPGGGTRVRARGAQGVVESAALTDTGLLEIYVIDVGQGDGILMRTPDDRWHLIDAGTTNAKQMLGKGAPNFIRWKFRKDLRKRKVQLENVVVSHHDLDHFGGVASLLGGDFGRHDDESPITVEVESLYHPGLARYRAQPKLGATEKGRVDPFPRGDRGIGQRGTFITELLEGKSSFENPARPFTEDFAAYAALVAGGVGSVSRLSRADGFLPGYAQGQGEVVIRVLGPILERLENGHEGLRWLSSESETVNGHSIVLRVDYGQARLLLTGDLNRRSQKLLLSYVPEEDFAADVVKACHHGSEEIDQAFTKALQARATVISSGDFENFAHPRPLVMGASARYGRESRSPEGEVQAPLVYSTELARSVKLGVTGSLRVRTSAGASATGAQTFDPSRADVRPGSDDEDDAPYRRLRDTPISTDLVYGLVNVRTDGRKVLCATREEIGKDFDVKVFDAGVSP
jgi:beta-lactamase superfamily II metal-dependent hydrolase